MTAGPVGLHWDVVRDERPWWGARSATSSQWHRYGPDVVRPARPRRASSSRRCATRAASGSRCSSASSATAASRGRRWDHTHVGHLGGDFRGGGRPLPLRAGVQRRLRCPDDAGARPPLPRRSRSSSPAPRRAARSRPPTTSAPSRATCERSRSSRENVRAVWLHAPRARYGLAVRGRARDAPTGCRPGGGGSRGSTTSPAPSSRPRRVTSAAALSSRPRRSGATWPRCWSGSTGESAPTSGARRTQGARPSERTHAL